LAEDENRRFERLALNETLVAKIYVLYNNVTALR
jgi:hypothetical protein